MSLIEPQYEGEPVIVRDSPFRVYLDRHVILRRVRELGEEISRDFKGRTPIFIGVLNGAFIFLSDLMRNVSIDCEVDFMKLSSYGAERISSGQIRELKQIDADLGGRDVIVVEDIVDSGLSMQFILDRLSDYKPASLSTAVLLHKPEAARVEVQLDYVGFRIENRFVLGYGLDYAQVGRHFPDLYMLDDRAG
jgi:hypoxanthine phosphoribosyltransferase